MSPLAPDIPLPNDTDLTWGDIVAVCIIVLGATLLTHANFGLAIRNTIFVLFITTCLTIISVYRAVQTFNSNPSATVTKPVLFWILQITLEL